jgi:RNA polymerase sigma factor (sigma-70 family)
VNTFDEDINRLTENLFRTSAGKMVSVLTKIFGTENLETAEDVVQQTFIDAIRIWKLKGVPENPSGWLFRVAKNKAIDIIRRNKYSVKYDFNDGEKLLLKSEYTLETAMDNFWNEDIIEDDLLRMMFACCHPGLSGENKITLILKTLCGFSTLEIAKTFLTTEDTISKRLYRTKEFFRQNKVKLEIPGKENLTGRILDVINAIYLLFNEGYNSTSNEKLIREELIHESLMLARLLTENVHTQIPETFALMSLICFHASRNEGRLTEDGEIILLARQDRNKWNKELIQKGIEYLNKAASGEYISSYHVEAAIAYEHCIAREFSDTNWKRILDLYEFLCSIAPSPVTELNKTVAVLQVNGPQAALNAIESINEKQKLSGFYLYYSLKGEIYFRLADTVKAREYFTRAIGLTHSSAEKKMLHEKLLACT